MVTKMQLIGMMNDIVEGSTLRVKLELHCNSWLFLHWLFMAWAVPTTHGDTPPFYLEVFEGTHQLDLLDEIVPRYALLNDRKTEADLIEAPLKGIQNLEFLIHFNCSLLGEDPLIQVIKGMFYSAAPAFSEIYKVS